MRHDSDDCVEDRHKVARLPVGNIDRREKSCAQLRINPVTG
jgi:hypothetical protein